MDARVTIQHHMSEEYTDSMEALLPALAQMAYDVSLEGSMRYVVTALQGVPLPPGQSPKELARRFVEVAVQPLSFQAAFGLNPQDLRHCIADNVDDAIALLKATGRL